MTCVWFWVVVRFAPGGHSTFLIMTFNNVSMEQHLYYIWMDLKNTPWPWASKQYPWFRQHLTTLQVAQVLISNVQQTYALLIASSCDYPWQITVGSFLYMGYWLFQYLNIYLALYVMPGIDPEPLTNTVLVTPYIEFPRQISASGDLEKCEDL